MVQLALLGLIALGAGIAWIYYSRNAKKKPPKSNDEDGKVIYLYEKDEDGDDKDK